MPSVDAELTLLGETRVSARVSVDSVEGVFLRLSGAPFLPLRAPVKVTDENCIWLGEVVECRAAGTVVVKVAHALMCVTALSGFDRLESARPMVPTLS